MAAGTPYLVATGTSTGTTSLAVTVSGATATGDAVILAIYTSAGITLSSAPSDSKSNTYTLANSAAANPDCLVYYCLNATPLTTSDTITVTPSSSAGLAVIAGGCSGLATASAIDANPTPAASSSAAASLSSGTLAVPGEVLFATFSSANGSNGYTSFTNVTQIGTTQHPTGLGWLALAYASRATSTASVSAQAALSVSAAWSVVVFSLKPAVATSPARYDTAETTTFTVPSGVTSLTVEAWGGGGGGGGSGGTGSGGGGGGGGSYAKVNAFTVSGGQQYTIVVGAHGGGGAAGLNNGTAGADSTFNSTTCVAKGGQPGLSSGSTASNAAGGASGSSTGDTVTSGGQGGKKGTTNGGGGGGGGGQGGAGGPGTDGATSNTGGTGGLIGTGTLAGGTGGNGGLGTSSPQGGFAATVGPGGGGGGGTNKNVSSTAGGNGADGEVIVTWSAAAFVPQLPLVVGQSVKAGAYF